MKILSMAPARLSLFGGGTDVEPYASTYGGLTINMAINLRQRLIIYSENDLFEGGKNEFPPLANPEFYYQALEEFGINGGHFTRIKSEFDGLLESGLGSSASAMVALVGAINRRLNLGLSLSQIAQKAWEIEVNKIGLFGGKQDQYCSAYGGINCMEFNNLGVKVTSLAKGFIEPLLPHLVLFYTGENRKSAIIQEGLRKPTLAQIGALNNIKQISVAAIEPIANGNFEQVGKLLHVAWEYKKESNKGVTNKRIDEIYAEAKKRGALGGKIMGAGGGGFMLFICPAQKRAKFINEMKDYGLEWWDFGIDWNGLEVRIL